MLNPRNSSSPTIAEENLFLDILNDAPLAAHRKPTRIYGSIFYCFCLAGYAIVGIGAPWIFEPLEAWISPLLCSCNVILLLITGPSGMWTANTVYILLSLITEGIFQQYLVYQVQKIRLQGYYMLSQKLKHIVRLPFATISYGTAGMLLLVVWEPKISFLSSSGILRYVFCSSSAFVFEDTTTIPKLKFLKVGVGYMICGLLVLFLVVCALFWVVMLVEVVVAGSFMTAYISYVHQYNSLNSQPDVLNSLYSPLQPSSSLEGLRYYDGRLSDQQMALLQYQRENIHFLSEEILRLQECLSKYERTNDGSTPQVDLAHLLAVREQEFRTLSAEMDQLHSELQLARSLIAEKDAEIQRVRNTNNQYIEENERLRAILGEWSARAAKLERVLEIERMSNLDLQKRIASLRSQSDEPSQQN